MNKIDLTSPNQSPIESSARYAQAMEAAARQRQQTYDDG